MFDGTSHLMLTDLSLRLPQIVKARDDIEPTLPRVAAMFAAPVRSLAALGDARAPVRHLDLPAHARALDAIDGGVGFTAFVALADALVALGRGLRGHKAWNDQGVRFALAEALAWLECAFAAVELADPARRAAVGAPPGPRDRLSLRTSSSAPSPASACAPALACWRSPRPRACLSRRTCPRSSATSSPPAPPPAPAPARGCGRRCPEGRPPGRELVVASPPRR
ncbi:hypothetical protein [Nannocystis pusilla]|uniref:hypothetical protein n=1 Tax=Nannocystis pusilla TaxID=889268 RepID=UPI003B7F4B02